MTDAPKPDRELPPTLAETVHARFGVQLDALQLEAAYEATVATDGPFVTPDATTRKVTRAEVTEDSTHIGRYPITGTLGRGGMGEVMEVRDPDLGRLLAAKVMFGKISGDRVARFVREARICGQLEHPNIVPVHELALASDGRVYFTMKKVDGETLDELVVRIRQGDAGATARGLLTRVELLQTYLKLLDAMAYAHSRKVIHRDLKPANVMVGRFGELLVMDWGLAKRLGDPELGDGPGTAVHLRPEGSELTKKLGSRAPAKTLEGTIVGTPAYMPPEQAEGRLSEVDERADVYSLGAILYELLTLDVPFDAPTAMQVIEHVVSGRLIPPSERAPQQAIPYELDAIVLRAMAHARDARYQTVGELRADVQRYLEGRPLGAVRYSPGQLLAKWAARHKALVGSVAAGVLVALLAGVIAFVKVTQAWHSETEQKAAALAAKDEAVQSEQVAEYERTQALKSLRDAEVRLSEALVYKALGALDEGRILDAGVLVAEARRVSDTPLAATARYLLTTPLLVPLGICQAMEHGRAIRSLAISPDGQVIAVGGMDDGIALIRRDGSLIRRLKHPKRLPIDALAYGPDGTLAVSGWDGVLRLWRPRTKEPFEIATGQGEVKSLAYSPDGKLLASGGQHNSVKLWDARTGEPRGEFELRSNQGTRQEGLHVYALAFTPDGKRLAASGMAREIMVVKLDGSLRGMRLVAHTLPVRSLAFTPDGSLLSASIDRTLRLWLPTAGGGFRLEEKATLTHRTGVSSVSVAPGGRYAITTSLDGAARWYSLLDRKRVQTMSCGSPLNASACVAGLAATGDSNGRVVIWRCREGKPARIRLPHPRGAIVAMAVSPKARYASTVGYFGDVQQLDVATGKVRQLLPITVRGRGSSQFSICYLPNGKLGYGGKDGTVGLIDPKQPGKLTPLGQLETPITDLEVSPDGRWLAASPFGQQVRVYDLKNGGVAATMPPAPAGGGLAFRPDGKWLAVPTEHGVDFWAVGSWERAKALDVGAYRPQACAFSHDGTMLATAAGRDTVRIYDIESGKLLSRLAGHGDYVRTMCFSPDDRMVASGSIGRDANARIWSVKTQRTLQTFDEHSWGITGIAFSPDGRLLITAGSNDQIVVVRGLDAPASVEAGSRFAAMSLTEDRLELVPMRAERFRELARLGSPHDPWAESIEDDLRRGFMLYSESQPVIAARIFERALRLEPNWRAHYYLAACYMRTPGLGKQRLQLALGALQRALPLAPEAQKPTLIRDIASLRRQLGQ